jgi:ribonuclease Z
VFVSHTHIDHFIGFDRLLRVLLGRDARLRLFGPQGFIARVAAKLDGYSWNLVDRFVNDLVFELVEVESDTAGRSARFRLKNRFRREDLGRCQFEDGVLIADGLVTVSFVTVDHGLPCLAFALSEPAHVNIWRNRLEALGLATGPWLRELKHAIVAGAPDEMMIEVGAREGNGAETRLPLGMLKREVAAVIPGQKIVYATDIAPTADNFARIERIAAGADCLYIEATFAAADAARATERDHLTTDMAGRIGAAAGVRQIEPFHFSPRYAHEGAEDELVGEVQSAFRRGASRCPRPGDDARAGSQTAPRR